MTEQLALLFREQTERDMLCVRKQTIAAACYKYMHTRSSANTQVLVRECVDRHEEYAAIPNRGPISCYSTEIYHMLNRRRRSQPYAAVPDILWCIHWACSLARNRKRRGDRRGKVGNKRVVALGGATRTQLHANYRELAQFSRAAWRLHAELVALTDGELVDMEDEDAPALAL
jgi:hypothetical protein